MTLKDNLSDNPVIEVDYLKKKNVSPEETNKLHYHPWHEIVVVDKGYITYAADNGIIRVAEKSIVFMPAHTLHNPFVQGITPYERYRVRFDGDFAQGIITQPGLIEGMLKGSYIKKLSNSDFNGIFTTVKSLYAASEKSDKTHLDRLCECALLITLISKGYCAEGIQDAPHTGYITGVLEYIKQNFNKPLTVEALAAQFYVSRSKLIYDFKNYCRMSVLEFITMTRLEAAKEFLLKGYSVSATSDACGFSSSSYFIKVFSGVTGITPLKFQIKYNKTEERMHLL